MTRGRLEIHAENLTDDFPLKHLINYKRRFDVKTINETLNVFWKLMLGSVAAGLMLFITAAVNAGDVKIEADNDSLTASNGQIKFKVSASGDIEFSVITGKENNTKVTVSLSDSDEKNKIRATRWSLEKNTPGEAVINLYSGNPEFLAAACTIKKHSEYLILDPGSKAQEVLIRMESDIAVMPDIIGENYVYYPDKIKNSCRIPYDAYYLLNLMNNGSAMFALMWNSDETQVFLGKDSPENKKFDYNKIKLGRHKTLHFGIITAPDIWYVIKDKLDKKDFTKTSWKPPFPAEWLMTARVGKGVIPLNDCNYDTWIIPKRTDGMKGALGFKTKPLGFGICNSEAWTAWGYWLGTYTYPCYLKDNSLYAKVPDSQVERLSYDPDYNCVIYAYRYETPVNDARILPYEYLKNVLDIDRYQRLDFICNVESKYPATCSTIDATWRIFKDETFKENRDFLVKRLDMMNKFVSTTDKRVYEYRNWALKEIEELKRISNEKPELKKVTEILIGYIKEIDVEINKLNEKIKTPEYSAQVAGKIIELIDQDKPSEKKEEECNKLGREIRLMGHNRDNLCAILRLCVKSIRGHIADMLTSELTTEEANLLMQVRTDCGELLRIRHAVEGK